MIVIENKTVRRRDKRIWYLLGGIFVAVFVFTFLIQRDKMLEEDVGAANLAKFDPGYIISDYQMSNYTTMNESQIQAFLKSKNSCNDRNIGRYTAGDKVDYFSEMSPPRTWHIKDGHFVCMADEEEFDGGTAAHIIYEAAQDYKINPQVLLVLLEKEQSLVRDTFPHSQQYRSATGYGCPDTAACSSKYYGLKNQIRNAAALFRTVLDGGWTNYPLGENYVQYNPSAACGGSVVNIRNLATSALYRYTPYQPNAVTLAGGSNSCSAYGNLNFYRYFEDWFGGITDGVMEAKSNGYTIEDGTYRFVSKATGKVISSKETVAGSKGDLFMKEGFSNEGDQFFSIKYEEDGYYSIINSTTGLAFDVTGAKTANSTHVGIFEPHSNCNQDWVFEKGDDGYYTITSRCSSRVLDAT
ncbi:MAG: RICIN domain-containing protein, partial [Bacteroidaceae bacterium]|nr:RICIN domain-containing protein [Bacteroidaceae bacterium]